MDATLEQTQKRLDAEMAKLQKDLKGSYEKIRYNLATSLQELKVDQERIGRFIGSNFEQQKQHVREEVETTPAPGLDEGEDGEWEKIVMPTQTQTLFEYVPSSFEEGGEEPEQEEEEEEEDTEQAEEPNEKEDHEKNEDTKETITEKRPPKSPYIDSAHLIRILSILCIINLITVLIVVAIWPTISIYPKISIIVGATIALMNSLLPQTT